MIISNVEGLPGVWGKKGTLAKYRREKGNMSLFLGNRGTKLYKLEDENILIQEIKSVISEILFMVIYAPLSLVLSTLHKRSQLFLDLFVCVLRA